FPLIRPPAPGRPGGRRPGAPPSTIRSGLAPRRPSPKKIWRPRVGKRGADTKRATNRGWLSRCPDARPRGTDPPRSPTLTNPPRPPTLNTRPRPRPPRAAGAGAVPPPEPAPASTEADVSRRFLFFGSSTVDLPVLARVLVSANGAGVRLQDPETGRTLHAATDAAPAPGRKVTALRPPPAGALAGP